METVFVTEQRVLDALHTNAESVSLRTDKMKAVKSEIITAVDSRIINFYVLKNLIKVPIVQTLIMYYYFLFL